MPPADVLPLAYVVRPPNGDCLLQFDTYRGGADLKIADATLGANGTVMGVGNVRSVLGTCAGSPAGDADVRGPEWSYDGTKLVFAARAGARRAGSTCGCSTWPGGALHAAHERRRAGSSTDQVRSTTSIRSSPPTAAVVFASTRSGTFTQKKFLPNSDLFRVPRAGRSRLRERGADDVPAQLRAVAGVHAGRARHFTAEKATPEFYQLSGRRMNWDLTDYHPLLAQRAQSTDTFDSDWTLRSATSRPPRSARGSIGTSCSSCRTRAPRGRRRAGHLQPLGGAVRGRPHRRDVPQVAGDRRPGRHGQAGTMGAYRSPFSLPNGEILASYDASVTRPHHGDAEVRAGRGEPARRRAAGRWRATARSRSSRRCSGTSAPRPSCSPTCRSWCSAVTPAVDRQHHRHHALPRRPDGGDPARREPAPRPQRRCLDGRPSLRVYEDLPPPGPNPATGVRIGDAGGTYRTAP